MDFEIPEELRAIVDTVARFVKQDLEPISRQVKDEDKIPEAVAQTRRDMGFKEAMKTLDKGRLTIAASPLGSAQKLLAPSIDYVKQRVQFGNPIAEFQFTQNMLADMAARIYAAN